MLKKNSKKIGFISSFLPNKCGIATFTSDLITSLGGAAGDSFEPLVVAMQPEATFQYTSPVKFEIRSKVKNDYISAADYINFSHVDVISLQHEFGLFGGSGGSHLNLLLHRVNAPIITTLHTVLEEPEPHYYQSMLEVCEASHKVIVMNQRGVSMLQDIYGVSKRKVELIPHGIPDLPFVDSSYYKHKFGMDGRKTILTFGLLSKNKGIELMLKALPKIVAHDPTVLYIILGTTHPGVIRHEGEEYRFSLQRMVKDLGLQDNVIFHNRFVNSDRLHNFLCAADIYVTPYSNEQQLTSGTLAFAVGTGKAVVSTPYWAAQELLAEERGRLVNFKDHEDLADTVIRIIKDEAEFNTLRRRAYDYGRDITWPMIGKKYWKLLTGKQQPVRITAKRPLMIEEAVSILEVPEPPLDHLLRMTDGTGLLQHAKFITPDRDHGYCTDDNSRAVIAMAKYYAQYEEPEALRLFDTYLSFVFHAQDTDGSVRNFMTYDRNWIKGEPHHDSLGRTLWAFGTAMAKPPLTRYLPIIKDCFDRSVNQVPGLSIRGKSYAVFGMADYLQQFPGASDIKRYITLVADELADHYERNSTEKWQWFEDILTYDNAVLPHALYLAAIINEDANYLDIAQRSCAFLLSKTYNGEHFSFIGCKGWYKQNGERAYFDQQPLEVASTTMMLKAAFDATEDREYLKLQRKAFHWFLGENDLRIPVYDFKTKGCADGLEPAGLNLNQGAESMLSFLLSLLCTVEGYSTSPKSLKKSTPEIPETSEMKKHPSIIKEVTAKPKLSIPTIEKPA